MLGLQLGCGDTPTPPQAGSLPTAKVGFQVYSIVAAKVGDQLIKLPHPAAKVVAVFLLFSAAVTELVIVYLDREQRRQEFKTRLDEAGQILLEHDQKMALVRDDNQEESFPLSPNRYNDAVSP